MCVLASAWAPVPACKCMAAPSPYADYDCSVNECWCSGRGGERRMKVKRLFSKATAGKSSKTEHLHFDV